MVFSSALFLLYFLPIFLLAYFATPVRYKNGTALFGSLIFYAWGAPTFIFILLGSIIIDFYLVRNFENPKHRQWRFYASILLNVGLLLYFKYANFFVENVNALLLNLGAETLSWTTVALPIGISFFTFQKISYAMDVYQKRSKALEKLGDYALYIILFPQLIAGPIVRFNEIAEQLRNRTAHLNIDNKINGLFRFSIGLAKKLFIANVLGEYVDLYFDAEEFALGTLDTWVVVLAYAFQIYFDFSGYSDMAIGIGLMMGFRIPENFNFPYISRSITEFWRRWHISLSRWMKDYLYIPLGGNRKGINRTYVNLTIVFLISGLWHGAAWTFVLWGAFHGLFLVLERLFLLKVYKRLGSFIPMILCFIIVLIGWVLFRANSLEVAENILVQMFSWHKSTVTFPAMFWTFFCLAIVFSFMGLMPHWEQKLNAVFQQKTLQNLLLKGLATFVLLLISTSEILVGGFNPFIYFRF
jgi:alginate O-acetyltransferase complex protein AlgI